MGGKEDAPLGGENMARRRRRYGWRFCACMQLKGWSKGALKVCLVNYERKECVHIFLHEKGWAWAVGGCSRAWEEMLFTMHFNRELTKEIREWNYDDY